jgi:hypothetical protein
MVVSRPLTTCRLPANNELAGSFTFHSFCGLWWRGRRWTAIAYAFFTSTRPQLVAVSSKEKTTIEHAIDPLPYSLGCLAAGNTVNLAADNAITLEASKNTFDSAGQNKSSGASVGVGYAMGSQNGFTIELAASQGKGHANQNDVTYNNTRVSGGKEVNIVSGGDLAMKGAVVEGNRVTADVGGNLNVESLQDTSVAPKAPVPRW